METLKTATDFLHANETLIGTLLTIVVFIGIGIYISVYQPAFFKKIKAGFQALGTSFAFANKHRVIWYTALFKAFLGITGLATLVILERYEVIALRKTSAAYQHSAFAMLLILAIIMFFAQYVSELINVSITHYILGALESRTVTLGESIRKSFSAAWLLFKFVLLDFVIKRLTSENEEKQSSRIPLINNILKSIVGLAWSTATYFIIPVIAEEKVTLRDSIRTSALTMKNSFGQVLGFDTGRSLLLYLPWFITGLLGSGCWLLRTQVKITHPSLAKTLWIVGATLFVLTALLAMVSFIATQVSSWVFNCAAYNYTRGRNTGPFDVHFIQNAVITEKNDI